MLHHSYVGTAAKLQYSSRAARLSGVGASKQQRGTLAEMAEASAKTQPRIDGGMRRQRDACGRRNKICAIPLGDDIDPVVQVFVRVKHHGNLYEKCRAIAAL